MVRRTLALVHSYFPAKVAAGQTDCFNASDPPEPLSHPFPFIGTARRDTQPLSVVISLVAIAVRFAGIPGSSPAVRCALQRRTSAQRRLLGEQRRVVSDASQRVAGDKPVHRRAVPAHETGRESGSRLRFHRRRR